MLLSLQHIAWEGPHKLKKVIFLPPIYFLGQSDFLSHSSFVFTIFLSHSSFVFSISKSSSFSDFFFFFNRWINKIWLGFFLENCMFFHICVLVGNELERNNLFYIFITFL